MAHKSIGTYIIMDKRKKINNIYQYLVWKFLQNPEKVSWPKEVKIAKSLIKDFGEQIFKDLDFRELKLESLAQFRTEKFKKYLTLYYVVIYPFIAFLFIFFFPL